MSLCFFTFKVENRITMKKIVALLLLVVTATAFSQENTDKPLDVPKIAIKIQLGETIETNGYSVTFLEVLEDSRCPTSATCVWEGRVRIKVKIEEEGKKAVEETIIFGKTQPKEQKNHTFFTSSKVKLEGIKVTPYPNTEKDKKENGYTLLVCAYDN